MKLSNIVLFVMVFLVSGAVCSQEFNLFLQSIDEDRYYGKSRIMYHTDSISTITLTAMVNGITLDKNHLIKVKEIKAVDNKSNSLVLISSNFYYDNRYQDDKKLEIKLEAPARNATKIDMQGSLLYFNPTEKNKGMVIIRDVLSRPGKNLLENIYPDSEFVYIDTDELINLKAEMEKLIDSEVEKRKIEVGEISEEEQREIEYTRQLFNDMFDLSDNRFAYTITFQSNKNIKDAYFSFAIFNAEGKSISSGYSSVDNLYQFHLVEPPTKGCYIQIITEVDTAIKELKFNLKNIILP
ncbi:hypothetical protein [Galbibacter sp.]|uniref:hypothetical protein n=1 Tax=Galbibacter sp. TaxID=2918471 RepID=UPI003A8F12C4